jgi:hypothetical protein
MSSTLLSLSDDSPFIQSYGLSSIHDSLSDPSTQYPSIALLCGPSQIDSLKSQYIHLFRRRSDHANSSSCVNIGVIAKTSTGRIPLIICDSDPFFPSDDSTSSSDQKVNPNRQTRYMETAHTTLLLPFVDVVVLFITDLGSLDRMKDLLVTWARDAVSEANIPPFSIIIAHQVEKASLSDFWDDEDKSFLQVSAVHVAQDERQTSEARFMQLQTRISGEMRHIHSLKAEHRGLISFTDMTSLFQDCFAALREGNEAADLLRVYTNKISRKVGRTSLNSIVKVLQKYNMDGLDDYLASALLFDAYELGRPSKFLLQISTHCLTIIRIFASPAFSELIRKQF